MQNVIRIDLNGVNSYLVEHDGKFMLIDTGGHMFMDNTYDSKRQQLLIKLEEAEVTKDNLDLVILTHGDSDHTFNAAYLQKEYEVPIAMHEQDAGMVRNPKWDDYKINLKYQSKVLQIGVKMLTRKIEALMHKVHKDFVPFEPDILLDEGMSLEPYGFNGTIYHTPGHTPGSICILDEDGNLFCGDLFANTKKPSTAINAMDFNMVKKQAERIKKLPVKCVFPGHGEPYEVRE